MICKEAFVFCADTCLISREIRMWYSQNLSFNIDCRTIGLLDQFTHLLSSRVGTKNLNTLKSNGLELHAYADDTQLYISIKPINQRVVDEGVAKLENCLTDIYTWMSQNKLKLNADKTDVLVMGTPQMRAKISIPSNTVNGVIVPVLNEPVGNLGAVFDPNMNMSAHVPKGIKSANYHLRNIGKIRKFLNTDTTKSAIVASSHWWHHALTIVMDFSTHGITDELLCRLQKVQNNAARVVSGSKKYDHITPVLKDFHWLPIRKRIDFKILLLTFKCMQGCAPLYLRELLVKQANTRTLRSNTKNLLQIPLTNLKRFGDRAFCAYAPRLWNELPDNIKAAESVQNFKKQLKTLLFRKEFNWLYGPWQLSNDSKALLNIIGGKGAITIINYYYYCYY